MAFTEVTGTLLTAEACVDAIVGVLSKATGYTVKKLSASTFIFEGPAKEGQRWSVRCVISKSSRATAYKMHSWLGEGLSGDTLINQSPQIAPEENGNYNKYYDHNIFLGPEAKVQIIANSTFCIIRFWTENQPGLEQYKFRKLYVYGMGRSVPEFGSKLFVIGSTPQVKRPSSEYHANAFGSVYQTSNGSINRNIIMLKHDGSGGKAWVTSTPSENGFYGNNSNTERRYNAIASKLYFAKSLTTVFLPIYIRSGNNVYGELEDLKCTFTRYVNTGNSLAYNGETWDVISSADYSVTDANQIGFACKE